MDVTLADALQDVFLFSDMIRTPSIWRDTSFEKLLPLRF